MKVAEIPVCQIERGTFAMGKTIEVATTFDEKVKMNIHWMVVFLGAGRFCEDLLCVESKRETVCDYEMRGGHLLKLVNTREEWDDDKKRSFMRVCEEAVIKTATEFRESRIQKKYFRG